MKVEALENRQLLSHESLVDPDATEEVLHPTVVLEGNTYNAFAQRSERATYEAKAGEITRIAFLDLDGDLVYAEFGGKGELTISFERGTDADADGDLDLMDSPYDEATKYVQGFGHSQHFGSGRIDLSLRLFPG